MGDGPDRIKVLSRDLELAQRKIYELELIKTELYNSKLELEARLNQVCYEGYHSMFYCVNR